jgi:membrane-bound serine protease (ClpP class)
MLNTVIALGLCGLCLLFLEIFLPGLIAGIAGGIMLIFSVGIAYQYLGESAGNLVLLILTLATGGIWWWWATKFQQTRLGRKMRLEETSVGNTIEAGLGDFTGQSGTALTPLRPGGTVLIGGRRLDALTAGEFIETGTSVRVVRAQGASLLVRAAV